MAQESKDKRSNYRYESLVGTRKVLDVFFDLLDTSLSSFVMTTSYFGSKWTDDPDLRDDYYHRLEKSLSMATERGALVRVVGTEFPQTIDIVKKIKSLNVQTKRMNHGFLRFAISDRQKVLLLSSERYTQDLYFYRGVFTNIPDFAALFVKHFEELWKFAD